MINLTKFMKGCTTIGELMNMPNRFIHGIYKEYINTLKDPEKADIQAAEEVKDQIEEAITGG